MNVSDAEIRVRLNDLLAEYGMSLGGAGGQSSRSEPSPELRAVIEQLMRDPSKLQAIAAQLQRDDPALFRELVEWIQNQQ